MIDIKTKEEIKVMAEGGKILADVLSEVLKNIKPGITELELDSLAEREIIKRGAMPGFKMVEGYKHTICVSTNEVVVHGIPTSYVIKKGDVVGVDCGVYYKGFHTDMASTVKVGGLEEDKIDIFLKTGKKALEEAIKVAKLGNRVGHISAKIQEIIEKEGYSVVRNLVGHGVGRELHEEPEVPGFIADDVAKTPKLLLGMTVAIEAIYNMGKPQVMLSGEDDWTIRTKDGSISGLFERTVAITQEGPLILT
jgi:methionyl aminopeptidase